MKILKEDKKQYNELVNDLKRANINATKDFLATMHKEVAGSNQDKNLANFQRYKKDIDFAKTNKEARDAIEGKTDDVSGFDSYTNEEQEYLNAVGNAKTGDKNQSTRDDVLTAAYKLLTKSGVNDNSAKFITGIDKTYDNRLLSYGELVKFIDSLSLDEIRKGVNGNKFLNLLDNGIIEKVVTSSRDPKKAFINVYNSYVGGKLDACEDAKQVVAAIQKSAEENANASNLVSGSVEAYKKLSKENREKVKQEIEKVDKEGADSNSEKR